MFALVVVVNEDLYTGNRKFMFNRQQRDFGKSDKKRELVSWNGIHPTVRWIIFKIVLNITTEEGIFNDDGNLFQSELPLN